MQHIFFAIGCENFLGKALSLPHDERENSKRLFSCDFLSLQMMYLYHEDYN